MCLITKAAGKTEVCNDKVTVLNLIQNHRKVYAAGISGDHLVPPASESVALVVLSRALSSQVLSISAGGGSTTLGKPSPMFKCSQGLLSLFLVEE